MAILPATATTWKKLHPNPCVFTLTSRIKAISKSHNNSNLSHLCSGRGFFIFPASYGLICVWFVSDFIFPEWEVGGGRPNIKSYITGLFENQSKLQRYRLQQEWTDLTSWSLKIFLFRFRRSSQIGCCFFWCLGCVEISPLCLNSMKYSQGLRPPDVNLVSEAEIFHWANQLQSQ